MEIRTRVATPSGSCFLSFATPIGRLDGSGADCWDHATRLELASSRVTVRRPLRVRTPRSQQYVSRGNPKARPTTCP